MSKRLFGVVALAMLLLVLGATAAFAEGYNSDGIATDGEAATTLGNNGGEGLYVRDPEANQILASSGPHGGYNTTTNKCQDCHSTHYAYGSFKLLRANEAAAACDYCHGGGGGSSVNIMMDNNYRDGSFDPYGADGLHLEADEASMAPVAEVDPTGAQNAANTGYGTGHTLGYKGMAPADIQPAFQDSTNGLACFSCHTPHGNSARVLTAFGSPSRPAGDGYVQAVYGVPFMISQMYYLQESFKVKFDFGTLDSIMFGMDLWPAGTSFPMPADFTTMVLPASAGPMAGQPMFLKWAGAATKIEDTVGFGAPQTIQQELDAAAAWQTTWMAEGPLPPTGQELYTDWYVPMGVGSNTTDADGYKALSMPQLGALFGQFGANMGTGDLGNLVNTFMAWKVYWGTDVDAGNINTMFMNMGDWEVASYPGNMNPGGYNPIAPAELEVWHKPLFPKGKFLLLKNPDSKDDYAGFVDPASPGALWGREMPDMKVADVNGVDNIAGNGDDQLANAANGKKTAIDWDFPLGPAATWGPFFYTDTNERFPLQFPWAPTGVGMENEFCASCHDGAAGMATQKALVYNSQEATYTVAFSHDSQARGCARQQYLNTAQDDANNFGPHCANCHTGASGCQTCHSADGANWTNFDRPAYTTIAASSAYEGMTTYEGVASVRSSAAKVGAQCLDGGFSYPHRTLGVNMLKDKLWGIDFDGTPVDPGEQRTANPDAAFDANLVDWFAGAGYPANGVGSFDAETIVNNDGSASLIDDKADNLDSVCIDCHGNATQWNGDESDKIEFTAFNPMNPSQTWHVEAWSLLLKGLP